MASLETSLDRNKVPNNATIPNPNTALSEDELRKALEEEVKYFARIGLLEQNGGSLRRLGPVLYCIATIAYWRGYSISFWASVVAACILFVIVTAWTSLASTSWSVGMKLLLRHLDMPHTKKCAEIRESLADLEFAKGEQISDEHMGLVRVDSPPNNFDSKLPELLSIMKRYKRLFYQSCVGNFVLMTVWCLQASLLFETGSWEHVATLLSIPLGSISYAPVLAQLIVGSSVLEMTSVLVSADVDSLRDAVLTAFLKEGIRPAEQVTRIDDALTGTRKRMFILNKIWGDTVVVFLAALLLLEAEYLVLAFAAPGAVSWYGRLCLVFLAVYPSGGLCLVLNYMAAPADRWAQTFALDLSTAKVSFEAQKLFGEGASFRGILKEEHLGFVIFGHVVSTRTVVGAAATAALGLVFCIIEARA